jgi:CubicO group peptidase (beta-lactamase class C family)
MTQNPDKHATTQVQSPDWVQPFVKMGVPGAVLGYGDAGTAVLESFGHCNNAAYHSTPVDRRTIFEAGSLSKTITAYLIYLLESRLALTPKIPLYDQLTSQEQREELLKDLKDPISRRRATQITTTLALSHSSGFEGWRAQNPLKISFEPGTHFFYSGEGYLFLQRFLEIKFGTSIEALFENRIFSAIGLRDTSFSCPTDNYITIAIGHDRKGRPLPKYRKSKPVIAGSLHTSLQDYTRFIIHLLEREFDNNKFRDWITEHPIATPIAGITWGKGWGLIEGPSLFPIIWHWGDTGGYHSFVLVDLTTKKFMTYFTNSQNGLTPITTLLDLFNAIVEIPEISNQQALNITALIAQVTHQKHGLERYWFDYDAQKPFYALDYD